MKKKIKKKGQAEDFLADFIPSLIIIVIGFFILSKMHSEEQKIVDERGKLIRQALVQEEKTIIDYLDEKILIDGKRLSLAEVISLSYKNPKYRQILRELDKQFDIASEELIVEYIAQSPPQDIGETIAGELKNCLALDITYPDGLNLEFGTNCPGEERTVNLPSYEGKNLIVKITEGMVLK